MKNTNTNGKIFRKVLAFVLAVAITVTFVQPLSAQAKAKVNKVKLAKQGFTIDTEVIKNVAKPLKKGKNNLTIYHQAGRNYEGYVKFVAPASKTYTFEFSNLKGKKSVGLILGAVMGDYIKGQTFITAKIGPKQNMYSVHIGSRTVSTYKKSYKSKIKLNKGDTIYLYNQFITHNKVNNAKSLTLDVKIK